jgi:hypothetical protein
MAGMLLRLLVPCFALTACDTGGKSLNAGVNEQSGGGGGGGAGGGGGEGVAAFAGTAPADWTGKKLVAQEGTVDGVAYTIQVPEGLPRDPKKGGDWDDDRTEHLHVPKVFVQTIETRRIQSLDEAKYHATLDARSKTWVRASARPDGWAVTYAEPDKSRIEAVTYRQSDDTHFLKCKAVQSTENGALPNHAKTREMLENICESIKAKPAEPKAGAPAASDTPAANPADPD